MKIKLGKDLIECLSWSLYENPIVLFREAIQNSIDAFQQTGKKWEELEITVDLKSDTRTISILDNGPGLTGDKFSQNLGSIGESQKKSLNLAGCRGIGRLSGLGICDEIEYLSQGIKEDKIFKCCIDAKGIRNGLLKNERSMELSAFLSDFVSFSKDDSAPSVPSFFKVSFKNVRRLPSDNLLNPEIISQYISNIAPVPIEKNLSIFQKIEDFYSRYNLPSSINIKVNNKKIIKSFSDNKFLENNKSLQFEQHEILSDEKTLLGAGWFLHHDYLGALGKTPFRGLRFRHKNILIGNEDSFSGLFKEPRFNRWTIGEFHPIDPAIRPSVKRDDFEPNETYNLLIYKLRPFLFKIGQLARRSSALRIQSRNINLQKDLNPSLKKMRRLIEKRVGSTISRQRLIRFLEKVLIKTRGKITPEKILECF